MSRRGARWRAAYDFFLINARDKSVGVIIKYVRREISERQMRRKKEERGRRTESFLTMSRLLCDWGKLNLTT